MAQKHARATATMHYTVVIALIIAVITTFLLGMLITEAIFNTGLGYFSSL